MHARASDDVWAVGFSRGVERPSNVIHWDGVAWQPKAAIRGTLYDVTASDSQIWIAGHDGIYSSVDGESWSARAQQSNGMYFGIWASKDDRRVVAVGATEIWTIDGVVDASVFEVGDYYWDVSGNDDVVVVVGDNTLQLRDGHWSILADAPQRYAVAVGSRAGDVWSASTRSDREVSDFAQLGSIRSVGRVSDIYIAPDDTVFMTGKGVAWQKRECIER